MSDKFKEAVKETLEELLSMSGEELKKNMEKYKDNPLAKDLLELSEFSKSKEFKEAVEKNKKLLLG